MILDKIKRWYLEGLLGRILTDREWERAKNGDTWL